MKVKFTNSPIQNHAKLFYRETPQGLYIEIDNLSIIDGATTDFWKTIILVGTRQEVAPYYLVAF